MSAPIANNRISDARGAAKSVDFASRQIIDLILDAVQVTLNVLQQCSSSATDAINGATFIGERIVDVACNVIDYSVQVASISSSLPVVGSIFKVVEPCLTKFKDVIILASTKVGGLYDQFKNICDAVGTICSSVVNNVETIHKAKDYDEIKKAVDTMKEQNKDLAEANNKLTNEFFNSKDLDKYSMVTKASLRILRHASRFGHTISKMAATTNAAVQKFFSISKLVTKPAGKLLTFVGSLVNFMPVPAIQAIGTICTLTGASLEKTMLIPNIIQQIESIATVVAKIGLKTTKEAFEVAVKNLEPEQNLLRSCNR